MDFLLQHLPIYWVEDSSTWMGPPTHEIGILGMGVVDTASCNGTVNEVVGINWENQVGYGLLSATYHSPGKSQTRPRGLSTCKAGRWHVTPSIPATNSPFQARKFNRSQI